MGPEMILITVKEGENDKGIFAAENIPAGQVLLEIFGKTITYEDTLLLGDNESYCLQIEKDKYIALHFPFFLANHSCEPNCGVTGELKFIAIRDISKGEELKWDYSTSMLERSWTMQCNCGEKKCRGLINDFDTLPQPLQLKYTKLGIVMPFIVEYMHCQT